MRAELASGARLIRFETLDSTMSEARRLAEAGEAGPVWILADEQTGGYGRRGTPWAQRSGDLAATTLFPLDVPPDRSAELSFVAAVALAEALRKAAPEIPVGLKWPNDVLVGGAKISGMLLELIGAGPDARVSLGIGVNLASAPALPDRATTRLADYCDGPAPTPLAFLGAFDTAFDAWRTLWRTQGFGPVRQAWERDAYRLGAPVRIDTGAATPHIRGRQTGLDDRGRLVVDTEDGQKAVAAGSLFFEPDAA